MKARNAVASSSWRCTYTLRRYRAGVIHMTKRSACKSSFLQGYPEFDPVFEELCRTSIDVPREFPQTI